MSFSRHAETQFNLPSWQGSLWKPAWSWKHTLTCFMESAVTWLHTNFPIGLSSCVGPGLFGLLCILGFAVPTTSQLWERVAFKACTLHCWVSTIAAKNHFENLLGFVALLKFDFFLFCLFISHLQRAWQVLHGNYAPVSLFIFLFVFLKNDCVSAYLWWKILFFLSFSHSLLLCPSSDFLSCFSSVCAMLFTVILHWPPPVTRPPPSPSTPLITVLWGSAVVETWSPCASRVGITEPKRQLLITRSPKVKRRGEAKCRSRSSIFYFYFLFCSLFLFFVLNIIVFGGLLNNQSAASYLWQVISSNLKN